MLFILLPSVTAIRRHAPQVELASVSLCLCGCIFLFFGKSRAVGGTPGEGVRALSSQQFGTTPM